MMSVKCTTLSFSDKRSLSVIAFLACSSFFIYLYNQMTMIPPSALAATTLTSKEQKNHFSTNVTTCPIKSDEEVLANVRSQDGEDLILLNWFKGLCHGTYLEMGALDGITFSNSFLFNKLYSWKGLLIEISPTMYLNITQNRPYEIATINAGVCKEAVTLHFVETKGAVSGIWEYAAPGFRNQWWPGITLSSPEVTPVQCTPLQDIIGEHIGPTAFFDFFSLDVEGAELDVLMSIDFETVGFGVVLIEQDGHSGRKDMAVRSFMESHEYFFLREEARSGWYVNKQFWDIYKDVMHQ
jgi:Methyltransferase FkbM domain